jgi:hypothetical protein
VKRFVAAALLACACSIAHATSYSTDVSDLWYIDSESGWGLNLMQQEKVLFGTLFVYGPDGKPTWFVASDLEPSPSGSVSFTGPLFTTTGPPFSAPWDPALRTNQQVGTATFTLNSVNAGTFVYTVNGAVVTKNVVRQSWRLDDLNGTYTGSMASTSTGCGSDGFREFPLTFVFTQSAATITYLQTIGGSNCTYNGTYSQAGRMGSITATGACGSIDASEAQVTTAGITFRFTEKQGACTIIGKVGGARR